MRSTHTLGLNCRHRPSSHHKTTHHKHYTRTRSSIRGALLRKTNMCIDICVCPRLRFTHAVLSAALPSRMYKHTYTHKPPQILNTRLRYEKRVRRRLDVEMFAALKWNFLVKGFTHNGHNKTQTKHSEFHTHTHTHSHIQQTLSSYSKHQTNSQARRLLIEIQLCECNVWWFSGYYKDDIIINGCASYMWSERYASHWQ